MQYRENSGIQTYILPAIEDPEGSEITIDIVIDDSLDFTTHKASSPQLVFNLDSLSAAVG